MSRKKSIIILLVIVAVLLGWFQRTSLRDWYETWTAPELPEPQRASSLNENSQEYPILENIPLQTEEKTNTSSDTDAGAAQTLPSEMNLDVPFTSQAPHANWDLPYQEACEEAAALMVHRFWEKKSFSSKDDADEAIRTIVDFQEQRYGSYKDTTAEETARFIRDLWGYRSVDVLTGSSVTIERMKQEVAGGFPVIVLAAGRELGNPNFRSPGPIYHALVIKGYMKDGTIITNDPGTRKGADYLYDPDVLMNAIHDWNDGDVANGGKAIIIIRND